MKHQSPTTTNTHGISRLWAGEHLRLRLASTPILGFGANKKTHLLLGRVAKSLLENEMSTL